MAASDKASLEELHQLVTKAYSTEIALALKEEAPPNPALLAGAAKFLKDNDVTADPADNEDLKGLQARLKAAGDARRVQQRSRNESLLTVVKDDLDEVG
jgi:hypothetical protein